MAQTNILNFDLTKAASVIKQILCLYDPKPSFQYTELADGTYTFTDPSALARDFTVAGVGHTFSNVLTGAFLNQFSDTAIQSTWSSLGVTNGFSLAPAGPSNSNAWVLTGTGTPSGTQYMVSPVQSVAPNFLYTVGGYINASNVLSGNVGWYLFSPDLSTLYAAAPAASGYVGRVSSPVWTCPQGVTSVVVVCDTNNASIVNNNLVSFAQPTLNSSNQSDLHPLDIASYVTQQPSLVYGDAVANDHTVVLINTSLARIEPGFSRILIDYIDASGTEQFEYFDCPFYEGWHTTARELNNIVEYIEKSASFLQKEIDFLRPETDYAFTHEFLRGTSVSGSVQVSPATNNLRTGALVRTEFAHSMPSKDMKIVGARPLPIDGGGDPNGGDPTNPNFPTNPIPGSGTPTGASTSSGSTPTTNNLQNPYGLAIDPNKMAAAAGNPGSKGLGKVPYKDANGNLNQTYGFFDSGGNYKGVYYMVENADQTVTFMYYDRNLTDTNVYGETFNFGFDFRALTGQKIDASVAGNTPWENLSVSSNAGQTGPYIYQPYSGPYNYSVSPGTQHTFPTNIGGGYAYTNAEFIVPQFDMVQVFENATGQNVWVFRCIFNPPSTTNTVPAPSVISHAQNGRSSNDFYGDAIQAYGSSALTLHRIKPVVVPTLVSLTPGDGIVGSTLTLEINNWSPPFSKIYFGSTNNPAVYTQTAGQAATSDNPAAAEFVVTVPNIPAGPTQIFVSDDTHQTNSLGYTIDGPPTISSIQDHTTLNASGMPNDLVTIYGSGFRTYVAPNSAVYFNGTKVNINFINNTTPDWTDNALTFFVPQFPQGQYDVTVHDNQGLTASTTFTINPPPIVIPTITGITPSDNISGAVVTLQVSNFASTYNVYFGSLNYQGTYIQSYSNGASTIQVKVPVAPVGATEIFLSDLTNKSNSIGFTIDGPPSISSVVDTVTASNKGNTGDTVVISGSGFRSYLAGLSSVTLGGAVCAVQQSSGVNLWSDTSITITVPQLYAGNYQVVVTDNQGLTATASFQVYATEFYSIQPYVAQLFPTNVQKFTSYINGGTVNSTWTINTTPTGGSIGNGNATYGYVDANGNYTAPASVPSQGTVVYIVGAYTDSNGSHTAQARATTYNPQASQEQLTVDPQTSIVPTGQVQQFYARFQLANAPQSTVRADQWYVNGVAGGNSTVGTITSNGLYIAPQVVPSDYTVNVQANYTYNGTLITANAAIAITPAILNSDSATIKVVSQLNVYLGDGRSAYVPVGSTLTAYPNQYVYVQFDETLDSKYHLPQTSSASVQQLSMYAKNALDTDISNTIYNSTHTLNADGTISTKRTVVLGIIDPTDGNWHSMWDILLVPKPPVALAAPAPTTTTNTTWAPASYYQIGGADPLSADKIFAFQQPNAFTGTILDYISNVAGANQSQITALNRRANLILAGNCSYDSQAGIFTILDQINVLSVFPYGTSQQNTYGIVGVIPAQQVSLGVNQYLAINPDFSLHVGSFADVFGAAGTPQEIIVGCVLDRFYSTFPLLQTNQGTVSGVTNLTSNNWMQIGPLIAQWGNTAQQSISQNAAVTISGISFPVPFTKSCTVLANITASSPIDPYAHATNIELTQFDMRMVNVTTTPTSATGSWLAIGV